MFDVTVGWQQAVAVVELVIPLARQGGGVLKQLPVMVAVQIGQWHDAVSAVMASDACSIRWQPAEFSSLQDRICQSRDKWRQDGNKMSIFQGRTGGGADAGACGSD